MRMRDTVHFLRWVLGASLLLLGAQSAAALDVGFDSLAHGEVVTIIGDVKIIADNPNRDFDIAVAFDTATKETTSDPDLQADPTSPFWSKGNLSETRLGRILILQENDLGCKSGICLDPDDEGRRPAGTLSIVLTTPVLDFGFDLVDVESTSVENAIFTFFDGRDSVAVDLREFLDPTSALYDSSIELGDRSANRFAPVSAESLGLAEIDRVDVALGGSGGIDNLTGTNVPEPGAMIMLGLGLAGLAAGGSRRD